MNKSGMAIAYAIRKKNMKSKGGMIDPARSEMIKGIMSKTRKYSKGGMCYSDGGEVESMAEAPEFHDEDFLSDEEQDISLDPTYPDPDHVEDTEGMGKKGMMQTLMARIRARHMGK